MPINNKILDKLKNKSKENIIDTEQTEQLLQKQMQKSMRKIEKEIARMLSKYSIDNELTYEEVLKNLTSSEYKAWRMDLKEYLAEIKNTGNDELLLELNTLAMKSRISREEELFYQIQKIMNENYIFQSAEVETLLKKGVIKNYISSNSILSEAMGIEGSFSYIDKAELEHIINTPWRGVNYKDNVLKLRDKNIFEIRRVVVEGIITGSSYKTITEELKKVTGMNNRTASQIAHTEHAYACTVGDLKLYEDMGVDDVYFLATLDSRTSDVCRNRDYKKYNLKKAKIGVDLPPLHPY